MTSIEDIRRKAYHLCDYGFLNCVIGGYLVAAMQSAKFGKDDIRKALLCLAHEFDELSSDDAAKIYKDF